MGVTSAGRRSPAVPWRVVRAPVVEFVVQAGLVGAAWLLVGLLTSRNVPVDRALAVLAFAAGVSASILFVVGAWMSLNRRARRVAAAVSTYTGVALLLRAVAVDGENGLWSLAGSIAVLGSVVLLAQSLQEPSYRRPNYIAVFVVGAVVVAGIATIVLTGLNSPENAPPAAVVVMAGQAAWSGAGVVALMLLLAGTLVDRPLLRRVGLAFATLALSHAVPFAPLAGALEIGAVAMFLVAAVPFLIEVVRTVGRQQEASRHRLAEAEMAMATAAERDHEMRNLVAGLSGAAHVLTTDEAGDSADGRRLLVAAGAELERLQRMLDRANEPTRAADTAVGPVLHGLAAMHVAGGSSVDVEVEGDPHVAVDREVLAQVLTNLLVNCARHAPGAHVWLRARSRGQQVRVEVADDGPGLPPGSADVLLGRGVRGPDSAGSGLGLAISAELVGRHQGTFTVRSGDRGCTAVLDLPASGLDASKEPVSV